MENVTAFIQDFVEKGYKASASRYNPEISNEQQAEIGRGMARFFHSVYGESGGVGNYLRNRHDLSEMTLKVFKSQEKLRKRVVFKVLRYKNPVLGDALSRIAKTNFLYAFDSSYDEEGDREAYISRRFYIAETDEGMKIIYSRSFDPDTGEWRESHDHLPTRVIDAGELEESLKLESPVEEVSVKEYERD